MDVVIKNLTKKLDTNIVLNDINLNLESGQIIGFVGRNGSGKSMLFKTICGFLIPDEGEVLVEGENIYDNNTFPKNTAALIENPNFLSDMSGYENLKLLASIKNIITEEDIIKTLEEVGLLEEKDKLFKKYSLGMKRKLGIAQVLMENPDLMIFDEPFNGLDESSVEKIRKIILNKKKEGKLILIATHIKEDIDKLCDHVYVLDGGKIIKSE